MYFWVFLFWNNFRFIEICTKFQYNIYLLSSTINILLSRCICQNSGIDLGIVLLTKLQTLSVFYLLVHLSVAGSNSEYHIAFASPISSVLWQFLNCYLVYNCDYLEEYCPDIPWNVLQSGFSWCLSELVCDYLALEIISQNRNVLFPT